MSCRDVGKESLATSIPTVASLAVAKNLQRGGGCVPQAGAVGAQGQELTMQRPKATMARPGKRTGEGQLHSELCCQHLWPSPSWSQQR
ncbi:hypothetical protein HaLaN_21955, partial [Haematococcus lacustris]